ncbi:hypothetical protein A8B78_12855 [Jannaschia sp. EhC01]|nr:hypothetical protein A8B78_12855 [Jannaschia sp. EhC01]
MAIDPADGRPWVLLPGTLCTGEVFDGFLDALGVARRARTVIELSDPQIEDYADALTAIAPGAIICGFSLGAIVTAHLADRLDAAQYVFFGLNPYADDPAKRDGRLALARDVTRRGGATAMAERLPPLAGPDPERALSQILSMADQTQRLIDAHTAIALSRPGALGPLSRVPCPVTLLTGTDDQMAPFALAQDAAQAAPQGRAVALEGLGHYALVEDPAACARALSDAWNAP